MFEVSVEIVLNFILRGVQTLFRKRKENHLNFQLEKWWIIAEISPENNFGQIIHKF